MSYNCLDIQSTASASSDPSTTPNPDLAGSEKKIKEGSSGDSSGKSGDAEAKKSDEEEGSESKNEENKDAETEGHGEGLLLSLLRSEDEVVCHICHIVFHKPYPRASLLSDAHFPL